MEKVHTDLLKSFADVTIKGLVDKHITAFQKILDICQNSGDLEEIANICEAMLS